tara:strand:+ start:338 stop:1372 length:1035 start_codon:yes stop_codon:yes gene_type:complete
MNRFEIKGPTFRHSDLKLIGRRINIEKHNNYYLNITKNLKNNFKEFKSKKYSLVDHDNKNFTGKAGQQFMKRSDVLSKVIQKKIKDKKIKILDFGCNKGGLLKKFSKLGYKNLYGYDLGVHYKKFFKDSNIKFIKNLKEKKNYYNLIIFSHTIAYTDDIEKLIILIKSLLKNDGTLFFNIQDVSKRPLNFFLADQKYHFNKIMIKNFFGKYGEVKFVKENFLSHEILFFFKFKKKIKKKNIFVNSNEIKKAKNLIKKIKRIKNECNILGTNLASAITISILKKKVKNIVIENKRSKNYFLKKKIVSIKEHKKNNIPLLVNFNHQNKNVIEKLKSKYHIKNIIQI